MAAIRPSIYSRTRIFTKGAENAEGYEKKVYTTYYNKGAHAALPGDWKPAPTTGTLCLHIVGASCPISSIQPGNKGKASSDRELLP